MVNRLLIVANAPSTNTVLMRQAVLRGATGSDVNGICAEIICPLRAGPEDVVEASGIILGTTENLGYMSGALKDFFDRCYYPCLEKTQGLPYSLYVRAGQDGTGTCRSVQSIASGLKWRAVQKPLVCRGQWQNNFIDQCENLGMALAIGLSAGIF